ncbi:cadherin-like beta sandwich domain-containing protein [Ruminococcus sp. 5_1_39BFAA]|uniref:cadherin-like beta sandwich domain-containing protein n=1 Tax=Ruminococcus sp. 5_1_39BFAA TaxID=457412 RepID=UPI003565C525
MRKRILAGILSAVMILGSVPVGVYGTETEVDVSSEKDIGTAVVSESNEEASAEAVPEAASAEASDTTSSEEPGSAPAEESEEPPAETPGETPAETPGEPPEGTPAETPGETPAETPGEPPAETPGGTPAETPGETPAETSGGTPGETPGGTPAETPGETPEGTPTEEPGVTPTGVPEVTPTGIPEVSPVPGEEKAGFTLQSLKAVYEGKEFLLFDRNNPPEGEENTEKKNFDLTLPDGCQGKNLEITVIPIQIRPGEMIEEQETEETEDSLEKYTITVNSIKTEPDKAYIHTLTGKEEIITIVLASEDGTIEEYNIAVHPEEKKDGEYLNNLSVYSSANGNAEGTLQKLERHEELDEEFGGKVYVTEYSSVSMSSSFYVSADLSENAPEDSRLILSAYTRDGEKVTNEMEKDSYDRSIRYKLPGTVFSGGAAGGQRAVYTLTAGNDSDQQLYRILVYRTLDLASIGCYLPDDEDMAKTLLDKKYDRTVREYSVSVPENVNSVKLVIRPYSQMWYNLKINGALYESSDPAEIPLDGEKTDIVLSMEQEGTYQDPEYAGKTYITSSEYHIIVNRLSSASADFQVIPENGVVSLYDSRGERITSSLEQPFHFSQIMVGETYTYNVSCHGYISQQGSFIAEQENNIRIELVPIDSKQEELTDNEWWNYRNNEENNGVTTVNTPNKKEETIQKWAVQMGGEWNSSSTPPLILGGNLYTAAGKFIYKLDKETGEILAVSDELAGSLVFALNCLTYAEGMLFAQIGDGQIQAVSATTLKSLWVSEPIGGQTLSPVTYKDGYIYTGTWNSETSAGAYYCLSVTDEDPSRGDEIKRCTWKYSHKGGFYWAGAYATEKYVVFGSDDGSTEGEYTDSSIIYSVSARSGIMIDKITGLKGDIRTSVVYENGYIYFATKGGYLYRIRMGEDGSFQDIASYNLGGMATASPVIYKGRIYVGVCGPGGQFSADGGHHFDVLQETEEGISLAYSVPIPGYPQAGALLSNAYENEDFDGDGIADGRVYIYFTYNAYPGGIYVMEDRPGQTEGKAEPFFEPDTPQQQYCISTICVDKDGTLYYKNDSCYLMAVTTTSAYLESLEAAADKGKISWNKGFRSNLSKYVLTVEDGAQKVHLSMKIPEGRIVKVNGQSCTGECDIILDEKQKASVDILVTDGNKARTYYLEVTTAGKEALLSNLVVSSSNIYSDIQGYLSLNPEFSQENLSYVTAEYTGDRSFLNIFAKTTDASAQIKVNEVKGVEKVSVYEDSTGSEGHTRIAVYFAEKEAEAVVDIAVNSGDGSKQTVYRVCLNRTDTYAPILTDIKGVRIDNTHGQVIFNSNEDGCYYYAAVREGETPSFNFNAAGQPMKEGENKISLDIPSDEKREIYIIGADNFGNRMETPAKAEIYPYLQIQVMIQATPAEAQVKVEDERGNGILSENGYYVLLKGNKYKVTISCEGYVTRTETIQAEEKTTLYQYDLVSSRNSDADLKALYVSSSSKYGSGILKLSPEFSKDGTNYSATYDTERSSLNVWPAAADEKASVKVYALGGISAEHVQKDETIKGIDDGKGRMYWPVYFAKGQFEARVRICVTAEDGTVKNTFLALYLTDTKAPVLKKVSASRISTEKASIVFKSDEKGAYYYKVTEAGASVPELELSGRGVDIMEGTTIISLDKLTAGEKDIHIAVRDSAGNVSEILSIRIPDIKKVINGQGNGISGTGSGGQSSAGLNTSPNLVVKKGEGSVSNVKKVSSNQTKHETENKNSKSVKEKDSDKKAKEDEKVKKASKKKSKEELKEESGEGIQGSSSDGVNSDSIEKMIKEISPAAVGERLADTWNQWTWHTKLAVLGAILGLAYVLFWWRARRYHIKKVTIRLSKANG